jgi:hypothetical protein
MSNIIAKRMSVDVEGDFVVFRIGIRINAFWKVHKWLPVFIAMPRMLRELKQDPTSGLLHYQYHPGLRHHDMTQYWESFEELRDYARDPEREHLPAWEQFNQKIGSDGDVGIWHETFLVREGEYETVYNNMPPHGLGASDGSELVDATGRRQSAAGRLGRTDGTDTPGDVGSHERSTHP